MGGRGRGQWCDGWWWVCCGFVISRQVPVMWSKVGYPCLKPLASWFEDFKARISFFNEWLQNVEMKCYWVPGFFFPQVSQPLSFLALSELCRLLLSWPPRRKHAGRLRGGSVLWRSPAPSTALDLSNAAQGVKPWSVRRSYLDD
jgi:hypothetical protein